MILFHGNSVKVVKPKIIIDGNYKDFSYGFYCTNIEKQAKRWELVKFKYPTHQIVFYTNDALKQIQFERSYSL